MKDTQDAKSSAEEMAALKEDLQQLRTDFGDLVSALKGEGGQKLSAARDRVGSAVHDEAEYLRQRLAEIESRVGEGASQAKRSMEEHPFTTAVIALCIGLVTGVMMTGHKK